MWSDAYRVPALAKTMLCTHFAKGRCERGEPRSYAHSVEELRDVPSNFRYTRSLQHQ